MQSGGGYPFRYAQKAPGQWSLFILPSAGDDPATVVSAANSGAKVPDRHSALCQKAAGMILIAGDAHVRGVRRVGMPMIREIAHDEATAAGHADSGSAAEDACAHSVLLLMSFLSSLSLPVDSTF